jgi:hypothetical protein
MSRVVKPKNFQSNGSASLGFKANLWLAADKLRKNMDAGEYKHVVFGLIFLKYISDSFEEMWVKLATGNGVVQHIKVLSLEEVRLRLDRRQTAIFSTGFRHWFLRNLLKTADCLRHSKLKA